MNFEKKWTKVLINWIKSTKFVEIGENLENVDVEKFYQKYLATFGKIGIILNPNFNGFLTENFHSYNLEYTEEESEWSVKKFQNLQIFTLLLYYAYCVVPNHHFLAYQDNLSVFDEILISKFFMEIKDCECIEIDQETLKKCVVNAFDSRDPQNEQHSNGFFLSLWKTFNFFQGNIWVSDMFKKILQKFQNCLETEGKSKVRKLERQMQTMLQKNRRMGRKNRVLARKLRKAETSNRSLSQKLHRVRHVGQTIDSQVLAIQELFQQAQAEIVNLKLELQKQKTRNNELLEEIDDLKEENEEILQKFQTENLRLQAELSSAKQSFQTLQEDHVNLQQDCLEPQRFGAIGMERRRPMFRVPHFPRMNGNSFYSAMDEFEKLNPPSQALQGIPMNVVRVQGDQESQSQVVRLPQLPERSKNQKSHPECATRKCSKARKYKEIIVQLENNVRSLLDQRNAMYNDIEALRRDQHVFRQHAMLSMASVQRERNELFIQYIDLSNKMESLAKHASLLAKELAEAKQEVEKMKSLPKIWQGQPEVENTKNSIAEKEEEARLRFNNMMRSLIRRDSDNDSNNDGQHEGKGWKKLFKDF